MKFNVQIKKSKEYNRTFSITAPNKIEAYEWGERQSREFRLASPKIEVFDAKGEEKKAGQSQNATGK
jgi:hypothetical protein